MTSYYAIVTDAGTKKIMEAMHEGRKVNIVDFAVGDGGGVPCTPNNNATKLLNEIWRGKVDSCCISEEDENLLIIETVMPSSVGGFTIREMGVFDDNGVLVAICNTPDVQKVKITDGVVHELNLQMEIALSNIDNIEIIVDPCVLTATKKDIENLNKKLNKYLGSTDNPNEKIEFDEGIEADSVIGAINEVFQLGSEKKNKLVENLTVMGIKSSTDETWEALLDKILDMTDTSKDTVTAPVLLEEYTAHDAAGEQITGTMPKRASVTVDTTGVMQDSDYTYFGVPEGYYNQDSKVRAINSDLKLEDAKSVVSLGQSAIAANGTAQFSATNINGYKNLTNADFLVEIVSGTQKSCSVYVTTDDRVNGIGANIMPFTLNKSYNKNTGVLNVSGFPYVRLDASMNGSSKSANAYGNITLKAYAIVPVI